MKIIFIGDVVGKSAREVLIEKIPEIRSRFKSDVIIVNAENAAAGYGLSKKIAVKLIDAGVDAITLGNHAWDQKDMLSFIEECPKIVRALNYPSGVPGRGFYELNLHDDRKIIIMQIMLRLFMGLSLDDPFSVTNKFLQKERLGSTCNAIIIDMHGEATSEKNAYGQLFDGKVSAILGTHTHIPTSDARVLDLGTAYQTDVGMTGNYNSVIGMDKVNPIHSFVKGFRAEGRFFPAEGQVTICGTLIETDDKTGLSKNIHPFQIK